MSARIFAVVVLLLVVATAPLIVSTAAQNTPDTDQQNATLEAASAFSSAMTAVPYMAGAIVLVSALVIFAGVR